MNWSLIFLPDAQKDLKSLSGDQLILVAKALDKVRQNPLPSSEGGFGKPPGNKGGTDLSGFLKIKLKAAGLRVVYKLIRTEAERLIIVIGARADDEVYKTAQKRARKYDL